MAGNTINWFEIYVQDMDRAKQFYQTVLGKELNPLPGGPEGELNMQAFPQDFEQHGSGGALVHMPGVESGGNSTLVYFSSEDCAVEESRIEAAGGKVMRSKISIGDYGFITLGIDPDGNMFGLHSMQ